MRYRPLGHSGLMVSVIGLGGNNFGGRLGLEETRGVVDAALDAGVTLIDTADIYGDRGGSSEDLLGQVLAGRRENVVLATKFGMDMGEGARARGSRAYIRRAIVASLRRLRTDCIDLYQYHTPDGITPLEETLATLDDLVTEGKVRYIGSSNFTGGTRLAGRESELTDEVFDKLEALERFGEDHGHSLLEVAIAGMAAMPAIASVIAGATRPEQVRANAAAGEWELSSDELGKLRSVLS